MYWPSYPWAPNVPSPPRAPCHSHQWAPYPCSSLGGVGVGVGLVHPAPRAGGAALPAAVTEVERAEAGEVPGRRVQERRADERAGVVEARSADCMPSGSNSRSSRKRRSPASPPPTAADARRAEDVGGARGVVPDCPGGVVERAGGGVVRDVAVAGAEQHLDAVRTLRIDVVLVEAQPARHRQQLRTVMAVARVAGPCHSGTGGGRSTDSRPRPRACLEGVGDALGVDHEMSASRRVGGRPVTLGHDAAAPDDDDGERQTSSGGCASIRSTTARRPARAAPAAHASVGQATPSGSAGVGRSSRHDVVAVDPLGAAAPGARW